MQWSRARQRGVAACGARGSASATAWSTDSALGSGLAALGARTPSTGLLATRPLLAPPAVQAAPRRSTMRDAARRQAALRAAARPSAARGAPAPRAGRHRPRPRRALQARAAPRGTAPACAPPGAARLEVLQVARRSAPSSASPVAARGALGGARPPHRPRGSKRASAGAGDLADALQELGAHVGAVARRVGRAEHQQAEGLGRRRPCAQRDHRHRRHAAPDRRASARPRSRR